MQAEVTLISAASAYRGPSRQPRDAIRPVTCHAGHHLALRVAALLFTTREKSDEISGSYLVEAPGVEPSQELTAEARFDWSYAVSTGNYAEWQSGEEGDSIVSTDDSVLESSNVVNSVEQDEIANALQAAAGGWRERRNQEELRRALEALLQLLGE